MKNELTEKPTKGNIPRTQSQNYGRRKDDDVPRRPMGRSQTMTRPARAAYTRSLDRERAKRGKILLYILFYRLNTLNRSLGRAFGYGVQI